jgi:hypothetical protein
MARKLTKELSETGITITFADARVIAVNYDDLSPNIHLRLMQHGLSQKLGDASAGAETVDEAYKETLKVAERLLANDWKSVREGTAAPKIGLLVEALARLTQRDMDECLSVVENMDDETKKKLRAHPQIKAVMADIRAEREKAKAADFTGTDFGALFAA